EFLSRKQSPAEADQGRRIQREICAEGEPADDCTRWKGDEQEPVQRNEVMDQPGEVTDAKTFFASLPHGGEQHQTRSNPGEASEAGFGKRRGEQKSGEDRRSMTWTQPRKEFHPPQLAETPRKRHRKSV